MAEQVASCQVFEFQVSPRVNSASAVCFAFIVTLVLIIQRMKRGIWFITGNDTGVGKTVLTALLARWLRGRGVHVAALKPVSSGSRTDARALRIALGGGLALDEINPWHFRAPLAPVLSARMERKKLQLAQVVVRIRADASAQELTLVEGAGGLLSPLGENFDSRTLIQALGAVPIIVCPNRLGAVNQMLLVLEALPKKSRRQAQVVLMSPRRSDAVSRSNPKLLEELIGLGRIHLLPWLGAVWNSDRVLQRGAVRRSLNGLVSGLASL